MSGAANERSNLSGNSGVDIGTVWTTSLLVTGLSPTNRL